MKKILLICLSVGISISASAQQIEKRLPVGFQSGVIPTSVKNKAMAVRRDAFKQDNAIPVNNSEARLAAAPAPANTNRVLNTIMQEEVIGFTDYDLQTNAAISKRLVRSADGSFSAAWTFSPNRTTNYPQRGTGYNYYNPATPTPPYTSNWFFSPDGPGGDLPQARTEGGYRTGFTNVIATSSGKEMTIAHSSNSFAADSGAMFLNWRANKGTGAWTQYPMAFASSPNNDTWSKACSSGDTVYVICHGTGVQDPPVPLYGQDGPILFSRSVDGGLTWPILRQVIPEIDSNFYKGFGGDSYFIDAQGENVAIVFGDLDTDMGLLKSTDGGLNWTKTIIVTMPIPNFDFDTDFTDIDGDGINDTLLTGSGDATILIDHSGRVNVWFSLAEWWRDSTNAAGELYAPLTDGLYYWNETMGTDSFQLIAETQDYNGNGIIDFPADTTCARPYGRYGWSATSRPSAGIDSSGTIYLTYMALIESADTAFFKQMHTHQYVITSPDNGLSWTYPWDLVLPQSMFGNGDRQECAYGAMARFVDNWVYILYQRDDAPGHSLSTQPCDAANNVSRNDIIFVKVEASTVSVPKVNTKESFSVSQNFPNPSINSTTVNVNLNKSADITIQVTDLIGKVVYSATRSNASTGVNTIQMNTSNWNKGMYFYTVQVQGEKVTKQMIVQ